MEWFLWYGCICDVFGFNYFDLFGVCVFGGCFGFVCVGYVWGVGVVLGCERWCRVLVFECLYFLLGGVWKLVECYWGCLWCIVIGVGSFVLYGMMVSMLLLRWDIKKIYV